MANSNEFNPELDKITEREMVYDIYSRIKIGKNVVDPDSNLTLFSPPISIQDIDVKTIMLLPTSLAFNINKLHTTYINISPLNGTEVSCIVSGKANLIRAYLERSLTDISTLITTDYSDQLTTFNFSYDVPFINNDILKLYYYIE